MNSFQFFLQFEAQHTFSGAPWKHQRMLGAEFQRDARHGAVTIGKKGHDFMQALPEKTLSSHLSSDCAIRLAGQALVEFYWSPGVRFH